MTNNEIVNTIAKIRGLIPKEHQEEIELKTNQVIIDHTPWLGQREKEIYTDQIRNAIELKKTITFEYRGLDNINSIRNIEPYQLILKNGIWYVNGYCLEREAFRTFRISRIHSLEVSDDTFTSREFEYNQNNNYIWNKREEINVSV